MELLARCIGVWRIWCVRVAYACRGWPEPKKTIILEIMDLAPHRVQNGPPVLFIPIPPRPPPQSRLLHRRRRRQSDSTRPRMNQAETTFNGIRIVCTSAASMRRTALPLSSAALYVRMYQINAKTLATCKSPQSILSASLVHET